MSLIFNIKIQNSYFIFFLSTLASNTRKNIKTNTTITNDNIVRGINVSFWKFVSPSLPATEMVMFPITRPNEVETAAIYMALKAPTLRYSGNFLPRRPLPVPSST